MDINSSLLLSLTTFVYLGAAFFYLLVWVFRLEKLGIAATFTAVSGFILQTAGIILRWVESYKIGIGHAPLSNLYESLVFFSWITILVYLFIEYRLKNRVIGAFSTPFASLAMAYASFSPKVEDTIQPLIPALKSNWLIAHVVTCFIGYASFTVACGVGIMYLFKNNENFKSSDLISSFPDIKALEDLNYQTIIFGFLWLSIGIITGAIWANEAWGTYWSWDPKETWSLITWFIYATALHVRFAKGWGGSKIAYFSIIGFVSVLFTYFGVNFLLSGLHSYGSK